ncbi:MAG: hypothetical protein CL840_09845 [Crocinitomicaceae bacterium]|nr:hypothetical protein [Crocinitomicaceae bacterium]
MKPIIISSVLAVFLLSGCNKGVDFTSVINLNAPLSLATPKSKETIHVNSEKWNKLVDFAISNKKGWEPTTAFYFGTEIWIKQNDFSFRYYSSGEIATIKFKNEEGSELKFAKMIEREQLDFLLN